MSGKVICEKADGIAVIRINRPEVMNAFDVETQEELVGEITGAQSDDNIKVLVISGTGSVFSTGVFSASNTPGFSVVSSDDSLVSFWIICAWATES